MIVVGRGFDMSKEPDRPLSRTGAFVLIAWCSAAAVAGVIVANLWWSQLT